MGCNFSKQKDIQGSQRDREPILRNDSAAMTSPIGIGIGEGRNADDDENDVLGPGSYTEKRIREQDFLKHVIEDTTSNFIDILGQPPHTIGKEDAAERELQYTSRFGTCTIEDSGVNRLPTVSRVNGRDLDTLLSEASIGDRPLENIMAWSDELAAMLSRVSVSDASNVVVSMAS
eukprot:c18512_g1_i1.p2 GENE.c18512_g1_i1~~c18512_g1_i1.p2  ORF type:complete len:175 (+),score=42.80 c18512_g1_i1:52-576(+)